ncbi:putative cytokinetic ring protein SteA [Nocardioides pacificus]
MKFSVRPRTPAALPGIVGTARAERRTRILISRVRPGDVAVLDHLDMDRATAQGLVDAGVVAVLNASPMISGRYPNLGPQVLVDAGLHVVDGIGADGYAAVRDGSSVRIDEGSVHVGDLQVAQGRVVDAQVVREEMESARAGLGTQLESFTHNSTAFLRREQDLLLHGEGVPRLATRIEGRPVVVVVAGHEYRAELAGIRTYIREQRPVLIGVDRGADALLEAGHRPDVVVVSGDADEDDAPSAKALRQAKDVVVRVARGAGRDSSEQLERLGVRPVRFESGATSEDAGLILADAGHASLIVGVGMHATLAEFLDRQRAGLASTYLTRLKVGPRLVDAEAVPALYSGRVRPRHVFAVLLAGLVALAAAIGVTPVGQEWTTDATEGLQDLFDYLQGRIS